MVKAFIVFIVWGLTYGVYADVDVSSAPQCDAKSLPLIVFNVTDGAGLLQASVTGQDSRVLAGWPVAKGGTGNAGLKACFSTAGVSEATFKFLPFPG
jgi:hypothetical protein